jgi:hypothetical protein
LGDLAAPTNVLAGFSVNTLFWPEEANRSIIYMSQDSDKKGDHTYRNNPKNIIKTLVDQFSEEIPRMQEERAKA